MLLVKTIVKKSTIPGAGDGLFADEFIPSGTIVWRVSPDDDSVVPDNEVALYSKEAREKFSFHAFQSNVSGYWIACFDGAQFVNHSDEPNLSQQKIENELEYADVAIRDILPGEELFDNYFDYDLDASRKLSI